MEKENEIIKFIEKFLTEELDIDPILLKNDDTLMSDLDIDSIDKAELLLNIEDEFPDMDLSLDGVLIIKTIGEFKQLFIK